METIREKIQNELLKTMNEKPDELLIVSRQGDQFKVHSHYKDLTSLAFMVQLTQHHFSLQLKYNPELRNEQEAPGSPNQN